MFIAWQKKYFERVIEGFDSAIHASRRVIRDSGTTLSEEARYQLLEDSRERLMDLGLISGCEGKDGSDKDAPIEGCYWPLCFDGNENNDFDLDICAICFGGLIYAASLRDKALKSKDAPRISSDSVAKQVLRTLVATRIDEEKEVESGKIPLAGSWPHYIDLTAVDEDRRYVSPAPKKYYPTVNQTTLAISTFVRLGFLETDDRELLRKRVKYLDESVEWLLAARNSNSSSNLWSQTIQAKGVKGISTIQTAYVYNTFRLLSDELRKKLGGADPAHELIASLIGKIEPALGDIEGYYSTLQLGSGVNARYGESPSPDNVSFVASCYLVEAFSKGDLREGGPCLGIVRELYRYLLSRDGHRRAKGSDLRDPGLDRRVLYEDHSGDLDNSECFETIDISNGDRVVSRSHFELSPYQVISLAYLKLLSVNDGRGLGVGHIRAIKNRIVFKHRINERVKRLRTRLEFRPAGVYVRAARGVGNEYPIYAIYNARNMLSDMRADERHRYFVWNDVLKSLGYAVLTFASAAAFVCLAGVMQMAVGSDYFAAIGFEYPEDIFLRSCVEGVEERAFPLIFAGVSALVAYSFKRTCRTLRNAYATNKASKRFVPNEGVE